MNSTICSVNSTAFPFEFYDENGTQVDGVLNDGDVCVFPAANCGSDVPVYSCCRAKEDAKTTGGDYMFIAFAFIFLPVIYVRFFAESPQEQEGTSDGRVPLWVKALPIFRRIYFLGMYAYVTVQILVPIYMRQSIQERLVVSDRNAVIASEAFLVPYNEIFQFIEDIVLVRVNYALGYGNKQLTNSLVHMGYVGALLSGIVAAIIGSILGAIPPALRALTIPGAANDMELYPGCDSVLDSTEGILPYWLIELWGMPGTQLGKVLTGFMMGALELEIVGWIGSISVAMVPIVWFTKSNSATNKILVLGAAEFTAAWCLPILATLYLVTPLGRELRENTGVTLSLKKMWHSFQSLVSLRFPSMMNGGGGSDSKESSSGDDKAQTQKQEEDEEVEDEGGGKGGGEEDEQLGEKTKETQVAVATPETQDDDGPEDTKTLLVDGLKIMFMDVTIQCCISLSIYLAVTKDGAVGYQLAAMQSALPAYGFAYALGMGIVFKIVAPHLLAGRKIKTFVILSRMTVLFAVLLVPLIVGSVVPFTTGLSHDYGENACEYAKDSSCVPFFTRVFGPNAVGGDFTLSFTFNAFAVGASIDALFIVLRAALLALVDLDFMMRSTVLAIVIYIPAIVVASLIPPFGGEAVSYFIAMYVPQFILVVLFFFRFEILVRRIAQGQNENKGSWVNKSKSMRQIQIQS